MVKDLKEWEERVRKAMIPPTTQGNQKFSPGINRMRGAAQRRTPHPAQRRQLSPPR